MASQATPILCLAAILFFLLTGSVSCNFISDHVFESHGSNGRNLLQVLKDCPVNFEFQNYTIITSQCKGPQYLPKLCCTSFKQFACPFAAELNDVSNNCATTIFSYINLYGKYPPGLFASECREGKQGLDCTALAPAASSNKVDAGNNSNGGQMPQSLSPLMVLLMILLFFHMF